MKRLIEQTACEHGEMGPHGSGETYWAGEPHSPDCPGGSSREVTLELAALTKAVQTLAEAVVQLAELDGHDQTADKARIVASDLADGIVEWEEV